MTNTAPSIFTDETPKTNLVVNTTHFVHHEPVAPYTTYNVTATYPTNTVNPCAANETPVTFYSSPQSSPQKAFVLGFDTASIKTIEFDMLKAKKLPLEEIVWFQISNETFHVLGVCAPGKKKIRKLSKADAKTVVKHFKESWCHACRNFLDKEYGAAK